MKNGGRIPWNATAFCDILRIFCLMGRHPMKGGSEYHLMAQLFRLERGTEELEEMDASEFHARRLNAKEVLTPMKGEHFIFPVADGTVKISGDISV